MEEEINLAKGIVIAFLVVTLLVGAIEGIIFIVAYVYADEVKCTFLWCEFTTTRSTSNISITQSQTCSINGIPANCSEMDEHWKEFE
jgi:hypothetical protein